MLRCLNVEILFVLGILLQLHQSKRSVQSQFAGPGPASGLHFPGGPAGGTPLGNGEQLSIPC